jgi:RNA polymerase sigma-70 factor (ECF subfamily)
MRSSGARETVGREGSSRRHTGVANQLLLQRAINDKDAAAFTTLYAEYYPRLVRYITTRAGVAAEAEDWAQDVFVQLWQTHARYEIEASAEAYLFAVTNQVIAWHMRRKTKQWRHTPGGRADGTAGGMPADPGRADWASSALLHGHPAHAGIKLSPKCCEAIHLRFVQGFSVSEAARTAGCSVAAFYSRLERALRSLRQAQHEHPSEPE